MYMIYMGCNLFWPVNIFMQIPPKSETIHQKPLEIEKDSSKSQE